MTNNNILLPSNYKYNVFNKLNSIENSAYIENLFSIISNHLCDNNILPFLPLNYGSVNGISKLFKYDISEEYMHFINEKWFIKNLGKLFTIDIYSYSDSESDSDSLSNSESDSDSTNCSLSSSSYSSSISEYDDVYVISKICLCNLFF